MSFDHGWLVMDLTIISFFNLSFNVSVQINILLDLFLFIITVLLGIQFLN